MEGFSLKNKHELIKNIYLLSSSIKDYKSEMIITIISSLLKHISMILISGITAYMVGLGMQNQLSESFVPLFIALIVCILLRAGLYYSEMWFGHDVAFKVLKDYRISIYKKIDEISPAFLIKESSGNIGQTLVGDVEILEIFLAHTFGSAVVAFVATIIILSIVFIFSPLLSIVMLGCSLALSAIPYALKKRAQKQGFDVRDNLANANALTVEGVQGLRELVTLNAVKAYKDKNKEIMQALYRSQYVYGKRQGIESMITQLLLGVFTVSVMGVAAGFVNKGEIDFSLYPVAVILASLLFSPILELTSVAQSLGLVFASMNRIQTLIDLKPILEDKGKEKIDEKENINLTFENVYFKYEENTDFIIKNASFSINKGEIVAIVGNSGAGKSTCLSLLQRYWEPQKGSIRLNDKDIRTYCLDSLRKSISYIPQNTYLFHTTVKENIRLGKPNASDLEVEKAAKAAYAHDFIMDLPQGYDTITGEKGFSLSGGQRQRIAIARALLRDSQAVIFDEAVSNLDIENELYIQNTIKTQMKDKTIIIVAHRLSTILLADKIIVLSNGTIVQEGTHDELINSDGIYKSLLSKQLNKKCE